MDLHGRGAVTQGRFVWEARKSKDQQLSYITASLGKQLAGRGEIRCALRRALAAGLNGSSSGSGFVDDVASYVGVVDAGREFSLDAFDGWDPGR